MPPIMSRIIRVWQEVKGEGCGEAGAALQCCMVTAGYGCNEVVRGVPSPMHTGNEVSFVYGHYMHEFVSFRWPEW